MEYTIQKLAVLAGISTRTIRYYDEIGLLKPCRTSSSGYRIYGEAEVDRLQQILFYREFDMPLDQIRELLDRPSFNNLAALREHRKQLIERQIQLDLLINNVNRTIETLQGGIKMRDQEKFQGFKKKLVEENETRYGKEVRAKYGDAAVDQANNKIMQMTEEQNQTMEQLSTEIMTELKLAMATGDPASETAQKLAEKHRQWLCFYWDHYDPESHAGLARMYVEDERFAAFYDKVQPGATQFLRDAILIYTNNLQNP